MGNELHVMETLTKLHYCPEKATVFLLQDNATRPTHSSYLQYKLSFGQVHFKHECRTVTYSFA